MSRKSVRRPVFVERNRVVKPRDYRAGNMAKIQGLKTRHNHATFMPWQ